MIKENGEPIPGGYRKAGPETIKSLAFTKNLPGRPLS